MDLGQRLRAARLEAGLSQRQLCGEEITRNMLSQIEHGTARPSMTTLQFLAARLGKPVSVFLEETAVTSPNQAALAAARGAFAGGRWADAVMALEQCRWPDAVFEPEARLLLALSRIALAEAAAARGQAPYAAALLAQAGADGAATPYYTRESEKRRLLLLAEVEPRERQRICSTLYPDDRELLLRAWAALADGDPARAGRLLEAAGDQTAPGWNYLRGEAYLAQGTYEKAVPCYRAAENAYPKETYPRLETCFRELRDFQMAYEYACKQR